MIKHPNFSDQPKDSLWLLPMGGCGEFGNNMMLYRYHGKAILVDAGIMFPDDRKLGVNGIIPDIDPVFEALNGVSAYVITHGHEDHIGALPYLFKKWPAPIYATTWTIELIRKRFERCGISFQDAIIEVKPGSKIKIDDFDIEYFYVNHSIPDACSLHIKTGAGNIFQTGDFKFEDDPYDGNMVDFKRLKEIGDEGVDLLLSDSTNATAEGFSQSEHGVRAALEREFKKATGRIFVTTFASNLWRLMVITEACKAVGKKLFVAGKGFERTLLTAQKLNRFEPPKGVLIGEKTMLSTPEKDLVIMVSGSQGEWRSMLPSIANGDHRLFKVKRDDLLILSSRVIPGNEKAVSGIKSSFEKRGAKVISTREHPDIHVSGHAHVAELEKLIAHVRPRYYVPVHGTFTQLSSNQGIGNETSSKPLNENEYFENGHLVQIFDHECKIIDKIELNKTFIDSDSSFEISYEILRERLRIGELGMGIWFGCLDKNGDWLQTPEIDILGLQFPDGFELNPWKETMISSAKKEIKSLDRSAPSYKNESQEICRLMLRRSLTKIFNKKPVVLAKILFNS